MKYFWIYIIGLLFTSLILKSCISHKNSTTKIVVDPVCGMVVNVSESYDWKYGNEKYYFDSYECKQAFESNPKNFLFKKCVANDSIFDLVCGRKIDLLNSFDYKYSGRVYHFHSYECKQTFKMEPEKFISNKCAPKDSIK